MQWHQVQPVHRDVRPAASRLRRTATLDVPAWERGHPARIGRTERARGSRVLAATADSGPAPRTSGGAGTLGRAPGPRSQDAAPEWLVSAAPFSVAVLWAGVTGAGLVLWAVTGRREWFDACRSESVLLGTGALSVLALLVASVRLVDSASPRPSGTPLPANGARRGA
jgi:hypothetical protein